MGHGAISLPGAGGAKSLSGVELTGMMTLSSLPTDRRLPSCQLYRPMTTCRTDSGLIGCELQSDRVRHDLTHRPLGHGIGIPPALRLAVPLGQLVARLVHGMDEEVVVEVDRLQSLPGDGDGQGSGRWQSGRWQGGRLQGGRLQVGRWQGGRWQSSRSQGVGRGGRRRLLIQETCVSGQECDLVAAENNGWRCGWIDLGEGGER